MKKSINLILVGVLTGFLIPLGGCGERDETPVSMAVEFNNHAAPAYVAYDKGWFEEAGLELLPVFQVYDSGVAIAAAMARGDIQIGYLGLTAAILTYARGVPIKVISGIHKYGYGLVARPEIKEVSDLEGKKIGSLREGTVTDILLTLMIDKYQLDDVTILRMSPSNGVLALITNSVDAAFIPEQHATIAEFNGFPMLIKSQDLWPGMQGDVLVVRTELIRDNPGLVKNLMEITQKATDWIKDHPDETAETMARQLQIAGGERSPIGKTLVGVNLEITPEIISRSMERIIYSTSIDPRVVQETIDYLAELGYIKNSFDAEEILDLRFIENE